MKKTVFLAGAFATMLLASACKKQGCTDPTALNYSPQAEVDNGLCAYESPYPNSLPTQITSDMTLTADTIWHIVGRTTVSNGATLTIEPGTIIKAGPGSGANACALLIARTAKINAQGTASAPIIFTSYIDDIQPGQIVGSNLNDAANGLWGGVIILGQAPISAANNANGVSQIEGIPVSDNNGAYGGNDPSDNSGIMTYVSIRFGGANIGAGNEINGLTLGGVGSGTTVRDIEIIANQDDGIEFFGGTVNVTNLVIGYAGDDAIDIDQGYDGDISNFYTYGTGDEDLEIDGPEGNINNDGMFTLMNGSVERTDIRSRAQGLIMEVSLGGLKIRGSFESDCQTPYPDAAQNLIDGTLLFSGSDWQSLEFYTTGCTVPQSYLDQLDNAMPTPIAPSLTDFDKSWTWSALTGRL